MKKLVVLIALLTLVGCSSSDKSSEENTNSSETSEVTSTPEVKDDKITYGSTFEFDDFEITVGDSVEIKKFESRFNEHDGKDMIVIPLHIKNIGDESNSINMFYVNYFNPNGTEADDLNIYNDGLGWGGTLRSGAEATEYVYLIYTEDGEYIVEFSQFLKDTIEVYIDVTN